MQQAPAPKSHNVDAVGIPEILKQTYAPTLAELDALAQRADKAVKVVDSDEAVGPVSDIVRDATAALKKLESYREKEKEPHLKGGREVDGFFKPLAERAQKIKRVLEDRLGDYLRAKAARERAEQQRIADAAAKEAADRLAAAQEADAKNKPAETAVLTDEAIDAERRSNEAAEAAAAKAADLARTRSQGGLSTLQEVWEHEILDRDTLDLDALRPFIAQAALDAAVRSFVRAGRRELRGCRIFKVERAVVR